MKKTLCLLALMLAACASERAPTKTLSDAECMALASGVNTLQEGDPLPRVVQVLGEPSRVYRVYSTFGKKHDVVEYDVGLTPCARSVLDARQKFELVFDDRGQLVGSGRDVFKRLQAASMVRVQRTPIDTSRIGY